MIEDLDKLIALQETDTNLRRLKKIIQTAEARRAEIEQEFEQHAFSIREIQNRRDSINEKRSGHEREIADNKTYLERAERNLKHAQNQKEYETAMREIDSLQKAISQAETSIVELLEESEGVEKELADRADEISSLDGRREAALNEFDTSLAADKKEFETETTQRAAAFATLPERLAAVYDRLAQRSRDGIAVAEVVNGSCNACYISLRPQVQVDVRRGDQIITCENCSRILFVRAVSSEAAA
ncbi:MAG: Zn-ribbon protein [Acidobacteria bacterium OLB17]|nr:MAG: Zn-ribbon protein [Acidobacteria bacterium OLB17]MCZ2390393.1 C4-type zinc ribbon domain-containing protein [Acidobacteriota bacterium]